MTVSTHIPGWHISVSLETRQNFSMMD